MGLFQKAVETYDAMSYLAGVKVEGKEVLAPIGHMIASAKIEITVDEAGNFVQAKKIDEKIFIPCTEISFNRTSTQIAAHPLCDQVKYVAEIEKNAHKHYVKEVRKWKESVYGNQKLDAIFEYLRRCTVLEDCIRSGVIKEEIDDKGKKIYKNAKDVITWRVVGLGEESGAVYEDLDLQRKYTQYYLNSLNSEKGLCMVSGTVDYLAKYHPKGILSTAGNAKVISYKDEGNFKYTGRFTKPQEALSVGYVSSQKMHNALKWILANEGVYLGKRQLICWNPSGKKIPLPDSPLLAKNKTDKVAPSEYGEQLNKIILGYKSTLPESESVVLAVFDAATNGRLSVTYYNELKSSDFLDRLHYWDNTCCCYSSHWKTTGSPKLSQIINYAFGTLRIDGENDNKVRMETDDKIFAQQMQRLIQCRVDKKLFPIDIMRNIVAKAEKLQLYEKKYEKNSKGDYKVNLSESILFTACSVIRKYRLDHFKEEWKMSLEKDKFDRSYQYGRLLAVMERIERSTYEEDEKREPNAIRLQAFFVRRPMKAFEQVMTLLKTAYYPKLLVKERIYYDKLIGEIMERISQFGEEEIGKSLTETYLLGYYLQKNSFFPSDDTDNNDGDNEL